MTQEKVHKLETDVAVIKNSMETLKAGVKSTQNLLRWFIGLAVSIIGLFVINFVINYGSDKVMHETVVHNSLIIGEMASQSIEQGLYKPSKEAYRTGTETVN